ncbi:nuclease-related domain-containing protein [Fictibacillus aquaticus]|uniref:nuclease-related domain-containing protein n=1 Tax=Fictibacillus aquaticus TaxID=2021314 RepID=UPI0013FD2DC7|nr:nuclease-related domain-containing protein [Fictibacillus aquaticus]
MRRTPNIHPNWANIESDFGRLEAGYKGELSLLYELKMLPQNGHITLFNIRMTNNGFHFFQVDVLLFTETYALIIEVKNISGTVYFDDMHDQMIRYKKDGTEECFPDPINQVLIQEYHFRDWLKQKKLQQLPVESLVVFTNPQTIIKFSDKYNPALKLKVIRKRILPLKIDEFSKKYQDAILSAKELKKVSSQLQKYHTEHFPDILDIYKIKASEILTGVQCPNCLGLPMKRSQGYWLCQRCGCFDAKAHETAFNDFGLLISSLISNGQARNFLQLQSPSITKRLLKKMNYKSEGRGNSLKYAIRIRG